VRAERFQAMLDALEDSHTSAVLVDSILCSTSEDEDGIKDPD
jgi:hypothetical protein